MLYTYGICTVIYDFAIIKRTPLTYEWVSLYLLSIKALPLFYSTINNIVIKR
jgi:hypothetical protein